MGRAPGYSRAARSAIAAALALCAATCGDESELPRNIAVDELSLRECKVSTARGELATGRETSDYGGLECAAWRFDSDSTDIDLINWTEGCGFQGNDPEETLWRASLQQTAANALELQVSWSFDSPSACGSCLHDFSIAARGAALASGDLSLAIATRSCNTADCAWSEERLSLDGKAGIRCRYIDWTAVSFAAEQYRGKLGGLTRDGGCDEALVAAVVGGAERCLKSCSADEDCTAPTSCVDKACRLNSAE